MTSAERAGRTNHLARKPAIGPVSLARENEAGDNWDRNSIFSMLTYRTSFCFWL